MADDQADDIERETIDGLWRVLLRLVPTPRRREAQALANTLYFLIERRRMAVVHEERVEGYQEGYEAGRKAEANASQALAVMTSRPDGPMSTEEEIRNLALTNEREPTRH